MIGSSLRELGELVAQLKEQYGIWTWGAGCLGDDGLLYMRLSAAVYNDLSEYERLRDAVLEISNGKAQLAGLQLDGDANSNKSSSSLGASESHRGEHSAAKRARSTL